MPFMQPELVQGLHWRVETQSGTYFVPGDVAPVPRWVYIGRPIDGEWLDGFQAALGDYVPVDWSQVTEVQVVNGWCGRMQAPGYLDATDWSYSHRRSTLLRELNTLYGD